MTKTCTVDGCQRLHDARGMCSIHYHHWRRHGHPTIKSPVEKRERRCDVWRCYSTHHAKGLCEYHYRERRQSGTDPRRKPHSPFGVFGRVKCEECGQEPMGGGRWCLTHFQEYVNEQDLTRRGRMNQRQPQPEWGDWLKRMAS